MLFSLEQSANTYEAVKKFLQQQGAGQLSNRRIESIKFRDHQKDVEATVGKVCALNMEQVAAILYAPGRRLYHVRTHNRGLYRGYSILVGEHEVWSTIDFDDSSNR